MDLSTFLVIGSLLYISQFVYVLHLKKLLHIQSTIMLKIHFYLFVMSLFIIVDSLVQAKGLNYIVVYSKGRYFKLYTHKEGKPLSPRNLQQYVPPKSCFYSLLLYIYVKKPVPKLGTASKQVVRDPHGLVVNSLSHSKIVWVRNLQLSGIDRKALVSYRPVLRFMSVFGVIHTCLKSNQTQNSSDFQHNDLYPILVLKFYFYQKLLGLCRKINPPVLLYGEFLELHKTANMNDIIQKFWVP